MGSKWRNVKLTLGLNLCVYVPPGGTEDGSPPVSEKCSDAALLSPLVSPGSWCLGAAWLSKSFSRLSKVIIDSTTGLVADFACEVEITDCDPLPDGRFFLELLEFT